MKKQIYAICLTVVVLVTFIGKYARADSMPAPGDLEKKLTTTPFLEDVLQYAFLSSPSIASSEETWKIFIENYRIGTAYPDPQITATFFPQPIETRLGPQDWNLTISQAVPFPGTLSQKGKVLKAETRISRLRLDKTIKQMVGDVSSAYHELVYLQKAIDIAGKNLALARKLISIGENAYDQDRALFYDISKARAQTAQIQYDILLLKSLETTQKAQINTLLDRPPEAAFGTTVDPGFRKIDFSLEDLYQAAMENQEDILIADETVQKAEAAETLSRYQSLPTFRLGVFYAGIGDPEVPAPPKNAGDDAMGIQLGLNIPLWFGKTGGTLARAAAESRKAVAEKRLTTNRLKEKISQLWFKLQNSRRLIILYENQLIPQAVAALQTAETWHKEGNGSFTDLLEIQATAYNFQLALARATADYNKILARIEQMSGLPARTETMQTSAAPDQAPARPSDTAGQDSHAPAARAPKASEHELFFITQIDPSAFQALETMARDTEAVQRLLKSRIDLHEIEVLAGLRNPLVIAAKKQVLAEQASFSQVMNLDDTLAQYSAFTRQQDTPAGPVNMKDELSQKFPFPGLSAIKGKIVEEQVKIQTLNLKIAQKTVITETRKTYWDLVYVDHSITITTETIDRLRQLETVAQSLYKSGKIRFQDMANTTIKVEVLTEYLVTLEAQKQNLAVKLSELLNIPLDASTGPVVLQEPRRFSDLKTLYAAAQNNRQELEIIRRQIRKSTYMVEMGESMVLQPFTLNLSQYDNRAPSPAFAEKTMASMPNSAPKTPWYGIDSPWLEQTRLNVLSMEQQLVQAENETDRMIRNAWFNADKTLRELSLYQDRILTLSRSVRDIATREYESGSISFSQAIDAYTGWLDTRLTIAQKQTQLGIFIAEIEQITGTSSR